MNEAPAEGRQEERKVEPIAEIARSIEAGIAAAVREYVDGAAADLQRFGTGIAQSMIVFSQSPGGLSVGRLAEIKAQLGMLAAMNGIRARHASEDAMRQALATAIDVLGPVIGAALRLILKVP